MATPKMQHCDYCGAETGVGVRTYSDGPESCGAVECNREAHADARAAQDEARERAEDDGYARYGGNW